VSKGVWLEAKIGARLMAARPKSLSSSCLPIIHSNQIGAERRFITNIAWPRNEIKAQYSTTKEGSGAHRVGVPCFDID
jgi:hypothetical protein